MTDQQRPETDELTPQQAQLAIQAIEEVERQEADDQTQKVEPNPG